MNRKKTKLRKRIGFFIFLLCCAVVGYLLGKTGFVKSGGGSRVSGLLVILSLIPAFFLVIAVHEAGHALAGLAVRFDFKMFVVGPFLWKKEGERWHFEWNKNINTAGGLVVCLPTTDINLARRFSIYAAGGPAFSLIFALMSFGIYRIMLMMQPFDTAPASFRILATIVVLLAILSAFIFFMTIIPMQSGGFSTDGARIVNLLKGGPRSRFELLVLKFVTNSSSGIRPAHYNTEDLGEALILATQLRAPFGAYIHGFLFQCRFDRNELEVAEQHLSDYINAADAIPEGIRNSVWLDAAFFYAFTNISREKATFYWAKFKPSGLVSKAQILATESVMAMLDDNPQLALIKSETSVAQATHMMDKGYAVMLLEKMGQVQELIRNNGSTVNGRGTG